MSDKFKYSKEPKAAYLTDIHKSLLTQFKKNINVQTANGSEEISRKNAFIQKLIAKALKADSVYVMRFVFEELKEAEKLQKVKTEENRKETKRIISYYENELQEWTKEGKDPNYYYPHPDDMIINENGEWDLKCVKSKEMLEIISENVRLRDAFLYQAAYEMKLDKNKPKDPNDDGTIIPLERLQSLNITLPERFQISEEQMVLKVMDLMSETKRDLMRDTYQMWQKTDFNMPRGQVIPKIKNYKEKLMETYTFVFEIATAFLENDTAPTEAQIKEKLIDLYKKIDVKVIGNA